MATDRKDGREGLGDDQGTRVGKPEAGRSGSLGMGSEAAEGIHGAGNDREPGERTALEGKETGRDKNTDAGDADRSGSEPLSRSTEHRSGYGGSGGAPVSSSDQREGTDRR
jgi:hypothetical protein